MFLYIVYLTSTFSIYKFGGSSFVSAQSFSIFNSNSVYKEISYTADGSVVIVGDYLNKAAYIFDYDSGSGRYILTVTISDGSNYSPLLCGIREDKKYISIPTFNQPTLFLNSSYQQIATTTVTAVGTYFSYDGSIWLLLGGDSKLHVYT